MYVYSIILHWLYILVIEGCFIELVSYETLSLSFQRLSSPCVYLVMYFTCEPRDSRSFITYIGDLIIFHDLIWVS